MKTTLLVFLWLFTLSSPGYAQDDPRAVTAETPEEARVAVDLATKALEQAAAWEKLANEDLDRVSQALAKKPKSAKAKKALAEAQKERDAASAYKTKKEVALKEELIEQSAIEKMALMSQEKKKVQAPVKVEAPIKVTVYPTDKYGLFAEEFESIERVDAYSFFNDPLDFNNKSVILDAELDGNISPNEAKFTMWRNFGKMHLIVYNVPPGDVIQKNKPMLLAGVITGFKKEVVSGEFVLYALLKLKGVYVCSDSRCKGEYSQQPKKPGVLL